MGEGGGGEEEGKGETPRVHCYQKNNANSIARPSVKDAFSPTIGNCDTVTLRNKKQTTDKKKPEPSKTNQFEV